MNENKPTLNLVDNKVTRDFWPSEKLIAISENMPFTPTQLRAYLRMLVGGHAWEEDMPWLEFLDEHGLDADTVVDWLVTLDKDLYVGSLAEKVEVITGNIYPREFPLKPKDALDLLSHLEGIPFHRTIDFLDSRNLDTERIIQWFEKHGQESDEGLEYGLRSFLLFADEDGDDICYDCLGAREIPFQD